MFHQKKCSLAIKSRQLQERDMTKGSMDHKGTLGGKIVDSMTYGN